ncbi:unnamed protein product [Acanthoscelides obtectus]|uniref:Methyltransferase domain-containing protein n=1 Tax=Acanthoscelides obtectus TaxID=200917 RepID=A0A9P0PGT8_ACAOB|nr:unnamed protein product [Acanthoscelides obtectus]CAK1643421.1 Glutathione S-transferase C-terminal domain-containing protein homolog [Acanthoscelides obtectus]
MAALFINAYQTSRNKPETLSFDIETLITIFVYQLSTSKVELHVKPIYEVPEEPLISCSTKHIKYQTGSLIPKLATFCKWPVLVLENHIIAGVCSVSRQLLKLSNKNDIKALLGFKEACLAACSESSIWTRFCEVDIVCMIKKVLKQENMNGVFHIPEEVVRFEYHLSKPVKMHNIYKAARQKNNDKGLTSSIPKEELNLEHDFGEGTAMTLADVILYPGFKIFFTITPRELIKSKLPLTAKWLSRMDNNGLPELCFNLPACKIGIKEMVLPEFQKQSLYTSDPARYKPQKRIYTKQIDIDNVLKSFDQTSTNTFIPYGHEINFNWSKIPLEASPNGGALPEKRANRKCEQLENLAKAVIKMAGDKQQTIVDFCSGSGHVGILIAVLLPKCRVFLVENKEQSLSRARDRIASLGLNNVTIVQSNLDYFIGSFDIGVALHACGVATDLVVDKCLSSKAHFVVCPCCYGGIKNCVGVSYPRSATYRDLGITHEDYLVLAHSADQTHGEDNGKTKQGYFCMDLVDTDRKKYAESCGYDVHLGKLQPTHCTNKNNLLVGIYKN